MRLFRRRKASAVKYVELFIERLGVRRPDLLVTKTGKFEISIIEGGSRKHTVSLHNAYSEFEELEDSLEFAVDRRVAAFIEQMEEDSLIDKMNPENILPIVRSHNYVQHLVSAYEDQSAECDLLFDEICHPFFQMFCHLQNDNMTLLTSTHLSAMNVVDPLELSIKNLRQKLPSAKSLPLRDTDDVYLIAAGGTFESSFLLDPDFWGRASGDVGNKILAIAPTRNTVWFSGTDTPKMRAYLSNAARHLLDEGPYPLAANLLTRSDGKWAVAAYDES